MPPAQRGAAATAVFSVTTVVNPTNLAPTLPTHQAGDLLLCFTCCRSATPAVATPAGWTSLVNVTGTNGRLALFGIIATSASMTAPMLTWSGLTTGNSGTPCGAQCAAFTGVAGIVDATGTVENGAASTTSSTAGADISTSTTNDLVLSLTTRLDDAGTFTAPTGFTTIGAAGTTSGSDFAQAWALNIRATAGSVTVADWTLASASSFASSGVQVALKETSVPHAATPADTLTVADQINLARTRNVAVNDTLTVTDLATPLHAAPTAYDLVLDVDNPVSHWKLGDTANATDRKAVRNLPAINGPITTTTSLVADNATNLANTFAAASSQQFATTTGSGRGIPYDTASWSIEAWITRTSETLGSIVRRGVQGLLIATTTGRPGAVMPDNTNVFPATFTIGVGALAHLVATFDGSTLILYVNGVEQARGTKTGSNQPTVPPGIGSAGGASFFDGTIDEVAWYGTALSPTRVLAHYNAGTAAAGGEALTATPTDTLAVADAITLTTGKTVALNDTLTITHAPTPVATFQRAIPDVLTVADVLAPAAAASRSTADTISLLDVAQPVTIKDVALADPIALADTNRIDAAKILADTFTAADTNWRDTTKLLADTATITDQPAAQSAMVRALTDTLALADQQALQRSAVFAFPDTLTIIDLAAPLAGGGDTYQVSVTDLLTLAEALTQAAAYAHADTITIAENATPLASLYHAFTDPFTIVDQHTRAHDRITALGDTISVADTFTRAAGTTRSLSDALTLADLFTPVTGGGAPITLPLADVFTIADASTTFAAHARILTDPITAHDALTQRWDRWLLPADTLTITELLVPLYPIRRLGVTVHQSPLVVALLDDDPVRALLLDDDPIRVFTLEDQALTAVRLRATRLAGMRLQHWPLTIITVRARRE